MLPLLQLKSFFLLKNALLGVIIIANSKACYDHLGLISVFFVLQVYFVEVLQCPFLSVHHPEKYSLGN